MANRDPEEKAKRIAKIRRGLTRLDTRFYPHGIGPEGPLRFYETLILAEDEERFED